jgi:hypothetical protein
MSLSDEPTKMARLIFIPAGVEWPPARFVPDLDHVRKNCYIVLTCQKQPRQEVGVSGGGRLVVE